jgi:hypothetical protein
MRRTASLRFQKTLEMARNVVNITFPEDFGVPLLFKTSSGMAAMFPDHVVMRTQIDNQQITLKPIGEGDNAASAVIDLFSLFAERDAYKDILITNSQTQTQQKFIAAESPYATIIFQRHGSSGATNVNF